MLQNATPWLPPLRHKLSQHHMGSGRWKNEAVSAAQRIEKRKRVRDDASFANPSVEEGEYSKIDSSAPPLICLKLNPFIAIRLFGKAEMQSEEAKLMMGFIRDFDLAEIFIDAADAYRIIENP